MSSLAFTQSQGKDGILQLWENALLKKRKKSSHSLSEKYKNVIACTYTKPRKDGIFPDISCLRKSNK